MALQWVMRAQTSTALVKSFKNIPNTNGAAKQLYCCQCIVPITPLRAANLAFFKKTNNPSHEFSAFAIFKFLAFFPPENTLHVSKMLSLC